MILTQDVLNQDVGSSGGLGVPGVVHSVNPELALFAFLQVWNRDFGCGVELIHRVHPPPISSALLVDLDDVTLDRAATVSLWWAPGESDAVLGLIFHLRAAGWAGRF